MEIAFVGAGACFANVLEDILVKCEKLGPTDLKWKVLHDALVREGSGAKFEAHYVDCGPELKRAQGKGRIFTYDISQGGVLTGAGNVGTGEQFYRASQWTVIRDLQTNLQKTTPKLFISVRGAGATNCGAGFLLDREILRMFEHGMLVQFIILPYRGEGIEASRTIYLTWQVLQLLKEYPDRYAPVIISNGQIMSAAQSFQQAGINWFYPLANAVVADIIVRILYPTLYDIPEQQGGPAQGAFELDSRQKYLDLRDFIRQPGLRCVGFEQHDDDVPLNEMTVKKMVDGALAQLRVSKIPDSNDVGVHGNLSPMSNPLTAFALLTGPRGQVTDMTKMSLAAVLEDKLPGSFPRGYTYDITPGHYELLLFPGGGVPDDLLLWIEKFRNNLKNPRYPELVTQATYPFEKVKEYFERACQQLQIKPPA